MNQVILQLFSRLNVLFLKADQIVFSSAWDYNEETLNTVCSTIAGNDVSVVRVATKTTIVAHMKESYQLLEELEIGGKKHYCVMDKTDYGALVGLAKEIQARELLFYSSLDYYRFLTKGLFMFLDEFSDREIAAYVFDGDELLAFDYATTSSAEGLVMQMLKKYEVSNIWNMARYTIPIPELENVINFSELSEEQRTALSPSFVTLRVKSSRIVDLGSMMSTIEVDKTTASNVTMLPINNQETPEASQDQKPVPVSQEKRSLFNKVSSSKNTGNVNSENGIASKDGGYEINKPLFSSTELMEAFSEVPEIKSGLFSLNLPADSSELVLPDSTPPLFSLGPLEPTNSGGESQGLSNLWSLPEEAELPKQIVATESTAVGSSLLDFSSLQLGSEVHLPKVVKGTEGDDSLFNLSNPTESESLSEIAASDELKMDTYDEAVHGKRSVKLVDIELSDVYPEDNKNSPKWVDDTTDVEMSRTTKQLLKYVYLLVSLLVVFLVYNILDTYGYIEQGLASVGEFYVKQVKPAFGLK